MKQRIRIKEVDQEAYIPMYAMEQYIDSTSLDPKLRELIKIRASQINGCAYCIQLHTAKARKMGEPEQRIYALSAWWESPLFTDEEKAVLALTDEVTCIADNGVTDETYDTLSKYVSEKAIAQIIMQIIAINAWNRIAVSTHMILE